MRSVKAPAEVRPYYFNFSHDLLPDEEIVSYDLTCVDVSDSTDSSATIISSDSIVGKEVEVIVQAGTEGEMHKANCIAQTSYGSEYERELFLEIKTVVTDDFIKQPGASFTFAVKFDNRLANGESLASVAGAATRESTGASVYGSIVLTMYLVGTQCLVPVTGGTNGETYLIEARGTTSLGRVHQKTIRMICKEN